MLSYTAENEKKMVIVIAENEKEILSNKPKLESK